jgi:hypothetical protein
MSPCPSRFLTLFLSLISFASFAADSLIRATDTLSFSFREMSTSKNGTFKVLVVTRICASEQKLEQGGAQKIQCVELGRFEEQSLSGTGGEVKVDVKKNSAKIDQATLDAAVTKVSQGMASPLVRLSVQLFVNGAAKAAEEFVALPPLTKDADNERKILQEKVVVSQDGVRVRLLAEIRRPQ